MVFNVLYIFAISSNENKLIYCTYINLVFYDTRPGLDYIYLKFNYVFFFVIDTIRKIDNEKSYFSTLLRGKYIFN